MFGSETCRLASTDFCSVKKDLRANGFRSRHASLVLPIDLVDVVELGRAVLSGDLSGHVLAFDTAML